MLASLNQGKAVPFKHFVKWSFIANIFLNVSQGHFSKSTRIEKWLTSAMENVESDCTFKDLYL